jgi:uncharacterized protein (TIGR02599 family)
MRHTPAILRRGFTLVEMLVSMTVLSIIVILLVTMTDQTTKVWRSASGKIEAFRNARGAFESVTQTLSQATLNTYYDYYDTSGKRITDQTAAPAKYDRYSELHFISGPADKVLNTVSRSDGKTYASVSSGHATFFQVPTGFTLDTDGKALDSTLNSTGYFVEFGSDKDLLPAFVGNDIKPRFRYRLVQFIQPTEVNSVYQEKWSNRTEGTKAAWFATPLAQSNRPARILAENIIAVIFQPKRSDREHWENPGLPALAKDYAYDSQPTLPSNSVKRFQLPPLVDVTLVAIDEASAVRLQAEYGETPPLSSILGGKQLFRSTVNTNDPTSYQADLQTLKDALIAKRINYRIFNSEVIIRASKWSED